jgi:hypothetical protein
MIGFLLYEFVDIIYHFGKLSVNGVYFAYKLYSPNKEIKNENNENNKENDNIKIENLEKQIYLLEEKYKKLEEKFQEKLN